ncbi:MAG: c-type cytochrome [Candidatus Kapaibacterium sp.]
MYMTPFDWMSEQHRIDAQEKSEFFGDGFSMRPPVDGTVMRGHMPYPYPEEPEKAGQMLVNPLENTDENLELGKQKWFTYCTPCHGTFGEGDSRLRGHFPNPPSIHSTKVRDEWTDGRIFHVIEVGQNSMPSYSKQMNDKEKWATVLYIRALQRALHAREDDLK